LEREELELDENAAAKLPALMLKLNTLIDFANGRDIDTWASRYIPPSIFQYTAYLLIQTYQYKDISNNSYTTLGNSNHRTYDCTSRRPRNLLGSSAAKSWPGTLVFTLSLWCN
jgi:hypothetical protein